MTTFVLVQTNLRAQFLATLTHDLRNPLAAISMAAGLIIKKPDSPKVPTLTTKILESSKRIDTMLRDLLDATSVQAGHHLKFEVTEFDLFKLVRETVDEMSVVHGDRFILEGQSVRGHWGKELLKRALENLINNAEKYGDPAAKIKISLVVIKERLQLSVHNDGPPIPINEQEAIFQVFLRAQSAKTGKKKGWGLGLALVRGVSESHGGSIILDSEYSRGTTFTIDLPLDSRPYTDVPTTRDAAQPSQ